MRLILASNNKNKLREFKQLVEGMDIELFSQSEAGLHLDVEETGTTFEENAYLKAKAVTDALGCAAVADDSGLVVDALNGEPGIYSARYGPGHDASDADRYNYLLNKLGDEKDRSARFVCCICCTMPDGTVLRARELVKGKVLENSMLTAREACDELCEKCKAEGVQVIGTKFVLYKRNEKEPKIVLVKDKKK